MSHFNLQVAQKSLIVTPTKHFHLADVKALQDKVLQAVLKTNKYKLVFDCAQLTILDHQTFEGLLAIVRALNIMSAKVVICGLSPSITAYLADQIHPKSYCFKLNLQIALEFLEAQSDH